MKKTFFCDESGNTGTNWTDAEQPFLIYGGWLVPNSDISEAEEKLRDILTRYPGKEIKSTRFFKMGKSLEYFESIVKTLIQMTIIPVFTITSKEYILAAKTIETFFDPAYNRKLFDGITWDFELKKKLVELIWKDPVINNFSVLIRNGIVALEEMEKIKSNLAGAFHNTPTIARNISGLSADELIEMIQEFGHKSSDRSLTVPLLFQMIQLLQNLLSDSNSSTTIFHDEIRGYDSWIEMIRNRMISQGEDSTIDINGTQWHSKLKNIERLELVDSRSCLFIQIADLLCGFLARCFKKMRNSIMLNETELKLLQTLFSLWENQRNLDFVLPEEMEEKLMNAIGNTDIKYIGRGFSQIDRRFALYIR